MNSSTSILSLGLLAGASLGFGQYSVTPLTVPGGFVSNYFYAESRNGTYFVSKAVDNNGVAHYLLYGPNSLVEYQDLTSSGGPYGPNTGGKLWPNPFILVNDKGFTVTQDPVTGNYDLYHHQNHALQEMPAGFRPSVLNNRNNAGGVTFAYDPVLEQSVDKIERWDSTTNQLKIINAGTGYSFKPSSLPGFTGIYGYSAGLSDTDEQIGSFGGQLASGGYLSQIGYEYLVGTPLSLAYGSYDTSLESINDNHQVTGSSSNTYSNAFVGDLQGTYKLLATPTFGNSFGYYIDNASDVLGAVEDASYNLDYGLWDANNSFTDLYSLTGNNPLFAPSLFNGQVYVTEFLPVSGSEIFVTLKSFPGGKEVDNSYLLTPTAT